MVILALLAQVSETYLGLGMSLIVCILGFCKEALRAILAGIDPSGGSHESTSPREACLHRNIFDKRPMETYR